MERVNTTIKMAIIMMENGIKIKSMAEEFYILKMGRSNMMVNGGMTFIMDGGLFIPKLQIGAGMKESLGMELKKVEAECTLETDLYTMESLELIKYQEGVEKLLLTDKFLRNIGIL